MKPGSPSATLTIDGRSLNAAEGALVSLRVVLANDAHHWARIVVWPGSKFANTKPGATLSIALGTVDSEEDVMAGTIANVTQTATTVILEGLSSTEILSRTRRSQTYLNQSVADIVRDLAADVDVDEIEADLKLEAYSLDDHRTVWSHLMELAELSGAELGSGSSGGLRFVPIRSGSATRSFRHGAEILEWRIGAEPAATALGVAAHGAGSEAGQQKWHWILRDPLGSATKPSRVVGGFHSRDAADQLAKVLDARAKRAALAGWLRLVGESKVRPGEIVAVSDLPGADPGPMRVLEVRHALDAGGFLTHLAVEGGGAGGLGGVL
jgi:hypothetical protein